MTRLLPRGFVLIVLCLCGTGYASDDKDDVAVVMEGKLHDLLAAIASGKPAADVSNVLRSTVDYASIARGVLGRHQTTLSDPQINRFEVEFEHSMQALLVEAMADIGDYRLEMGKVRRMGDNRAQVFAVVHTASNNTFDIASSVSSESGAWMVRNLIVDGVNLGLTYRNQFDQLMLETGDPEQAINRWRSAVEETAQ